MKNKVKIGLFGSALVFSLVASGIVIGEMAKEVESFTAGYIKEEEREFILNNPLKPLYTPNDQYYSSKQYVSHNHVGDIETAWNTYRGSGTKIAVIDTGINYKHPDFIKADGTTSILPESKYYFVNSAGTKVDYQVASTHGYDILLHDWDSEYSEWNAHGTNSAGCAAARTGDGVGTIGIAPEADLLIYKTDMYLSSISYAIKDAADQGADVINMSLGSYAETFTDGYGDEQTGNASTATYLQNIIDYAHNKGVIVIAAAGNEKTNHHSYPACNTHVIGVGALSSNSSTTNATFSNFNYTTETDPSGDHNVDVVAPGYVYTPTEGGTQSSPDYSAYCSTQGTSFASPIVAGAAALWKQKNPTGTPDEFETALYATAVDIGSTGFDYKYGNGRLDVGALLGVEGSERVSLKDTSITINAGSSKTLEVTYNSGPITWSSENTSIATVDSNGKVQGIAAGTTKIWAKVGENASAYCNVTVNAYVPATSLTFNPSSATLAVGGKTKINVTVNPSNASDKSVLFESEDESIATVDDEGNVEAKKVGSTRIYCMGADDADGYFGVTVKSNSELVYSKITSDQADYSGDYLFAYESAGVAMNSALSTIDATNNNISVDIINSQIAASDAVNAAKFTISAGSVSGTWHIKGTNGQYIYGGTSNGISSTSTASSTCDNTIVFSGTTPLIHSGSTYLKYNASSGQNRFRFMTGETSNIAMYKLGGGSIEKPDKVLSSISVSYTGGEVYIGDSLDTSKITVTAKYTYPSYYPDETVTGWTYEGFDSSTKGSKTVTVSYGGKTATFNVTVAENPNSPLTSIEMTGVPSTIKYRDTFNKSAISITAHYEAKEDASVTSSVTLPDLDTSVLGDHEYTVSYTENGITKSASTTIKVTNNGAKPAEVIGSSTWNQVTSSSDLVIGKKYVIAAYSGNYAMSTALSSGDIGQASITKNTSAKTATLTDNVQVVTLCKGANDTNYSFQASDGKYVGVTKSGSTYYLKNNQSLTSNSTWTISIGSATTYKATISCSYSSTTVKIRYNSSKFQAKTSGGNDIIMYKQNVTESSTSWTGEQQAKSYASFFMSKTNEGCSSKSLSLLSQEWSTLKNEFSYMIDAGKDAFVTSSDETIAEARERYRIIIANYGLEAFVADSSGTALTALNVGLPHSIGDEGEMVAVTLGLSILSFGAFVLIKRKKA